MSEEIKEEKEVKPVSKVIYQMLVRDIGLYGGTHGLDKLFHLLSAITNMIAYLGIETISKEFNKEMDRLKNFEEKAGFSTPYRTIKNWDGMQEILDDIRPKINEIKLEYDRFRAMKLKEDDKDEKIKKATKRFSPYQPEIYYLFNFLLKLTSLQDATIPADAWITPDTAKLIKLPPTKLRPHRMNELPGGTV